jgi:signal transduction histidine kinase
MSDLSFALDASLRFTSIGRELARQVGAGEDSLSGTPLTRTLELEADTNGDLPLLQALATRSSFAGQKAHARRGGAALLLSAEPQLSEDGAFLGYRGTAVPAASLGAAEATDSSAEWDALLRQPLDVIVTEAERISDRTEGPLRSDYAAYASDIAGAARHLLDVLRSMGQDAAEPDASNEPIDLAALGAEAAGLVQPQAAEAGVTLELEGATTLPAVGQPRAVTQILVNLIGNAVRYSPRGSVVRIEAEAGANASISVTDNGPGVATEDQKRIFERFEQVSSQGAGAGLGLTISRRLARSMGGDISLTSTPGAGARFTLTLPPR